MFIYVPQLHHSNAQPLFVTSEYENRSARASDGHLIFTRKLWHAPQWDES